MAATEPAAPAPNAAETPDAAREFWFRLVLLGLVLLVVGFTFGAIANGLYPCVPAPGSSVEPPLTACVGSLSPWAGVGLVGVALALLGYRRAR